MPKDLLRLPDDVAAWSTEHAIRRNEVLDKLALATAALPDAVMQTDPHQAQLLAFLVELVDARLVVEVGTFTGYGALAMALALPADGRLITLDVGDWEGVGDRHWREAGVADRIERRMGPAEASLAELRDGPEAGRVDLIYIDADKKGYPAYLELALELVRPGGVIAVDNMFWGGAVADAADDSHQVQALRTVIDRVRSDLRLAMTLVPIADGLLLLRVRDERASPPKPHRRGGT